MCCVKPWTREEHAAGANTMRVRGFWQLRPSTCQLRQQRGQASGAIQQELCGHEQHQVGRVSRRGQICAGTASPALTLCRQIQTDVRSGSMQILSESVLEIMPCLLREPACSCCGNRAGPDQRLGRTCCISAAACSRTLSSNCIGCPTALGARCLHVWLGCTPLQFTVPYNTCSLA